MLFPDMDSFWDKVLTELYTIFENITSFKEYNPLLERVVSQFIERTFEEFLHKLHIPIIPESEKVSNENIAKLEAELHKITSIQEKHHKSWDIPGHLRHPYLQRKYLVFCVAYQYLKINDISRHNSSIDCVRKLQVPGLFTIICHCTLFGGVLEVILQIATLYRHIADHATKCNMDEQMKKAIEALVCQMEDKLLPDKSNFLDQLSKINMKSETESCETSKIEEMYLSQVNNTRIAGIKADLQNRDYINWVKGTLSLKYMGEGIRRFTLMKFEEFLLSLPGKGDHFDDGSNIRKMCEEGVVVKSEKWLYPVRNIHCQQCKELFDYVKRHHKGLYRNSGFHNCKNITVGGAWGLAKLFIPGNCNQVASLEESDTQALFQLIKNCGIFDQCSIENIEKIVKIRNSLMHSAKLLMTDQCLNELFDSELTFIKEAVQYYCSDNETVRHNLISAREDIQGIRASVLGIKYLVHRADEAIQYESDDLKKHEDRANDDVSDRCQILERKEQLKQKTENYEHVKRLFLSIEEKVKLHNTQSAINNTVSGIRKQVMELSTLIHQAKKSMQHKSEMLSHEDNGDYIEQQCKERELQQNKMELYGDVEYLLTSFDDLVKFQKPQMDTAMVQLEELINEELNDQTYEDKNEIECPLEDLQKSKHEETDKRAATSKKVTDRRQTEQLTKANAALNGVLAAKTKAGNDLKEIQEKKSQFDVLVLEESQKLTELENQKSNLEAEVMNEAQKLKELRVSTLKLEAENQNITDEKD